MQDKAGAGQPAQPAPRPVRQREGHEERAADHQRPAASPRQQHHAGQSRKRSHPRSNTTGDERRHRLHVPVFIRSLIGISVSPPHPPIRRSSGQHEEGLPEEADRSRLDLGSSHHHAERPPEEVRPGRLEGAVSQTQTRNAHHFVRQLPLF